MKHAKFETEEVTIVFASEGMMDDYGVPNSPIWWTPSDVDVVSVEILGVDVDYSKLPKNLQDAIYELWAELSDCDWEPID